MGNARAGSNPARCDHFATDDDATPVPKFKRICYSCNIASMAEWLRRQTRNLMGNARAGSNPARCDHFATDGDATPVLRFGRIRYSCNM